MDLSWTTRFYGDPQRPRSVHLTAPGRDTPHQVLDATTHTPTDAGPVEFTLTVQDSEGRETARRQIEAIRDGFMFRLFGASRPCSDFPTIIDNAAHSMSLDLGIKAATVRNLTHRGIAVSHEGVTVQLAPFGSGGDSTPDFARTSANGIWTMMMTASSIEMCPPPSKTGGDFSRFNAAPPPAMGIEITTACER